MTNPEKLSTLNMIKNAAFNTNTDSGIICLHYYQHKSLKFHAQDIRFVVFSSIL